MPNRVPGHEYWLGYQLDESGLRRAQVGDLQKFEVKTEDSRGWVEYKITRVDETGVWGRQINSTVREFRPCLV